MARIVVPGIRGSIAFQPWNEHLFTDRQNKLCVQFISRAFNGYNMADHWRLQSAIVHCDANTWYAYTPVVIVGRKWADTGVYDEIENLNNGGIAFAGYRENDPNVQNRPFNWVFQQWLNSNYDYANANWFYNAFAFNIRYYSYDWTTSALQWWKDPNMCAELTRWWQAFGNDANFRFGMQWKATYLPPGSSGDPYIADHVSYIGANEQGGWITQVNGMFIPSESYVYASRIYHLTLEQYNPATSQWITRTDVYFDEPAVYSARLWYENVETYPSYNGQYLEYPRNLHQLIF